MTDRRHEVMYSLAAHFAFAISIILDGLRRAAEGVSFYILAIAGAFLVLPAFIYFVTKPRTFFLLPEGLDHKENSQTLTEFRRVGYSVMSWLYVAGWSVSWLILAPMLPRFVAAYFFMFGVVTTILISKYLFPSTSNKLSL